MPLLPTIHDYRGSDCKIFQKYLKKKIDEKPMNITDKYLNLHFVLWGGDIENFDDSNYYYVKYN